jgi:hypothetical protein
LIVFYSKDKVGFVRERVVHENSSGKRKVTNKIGQGIAIARMLEA